MMCMRLEKLGYSMVDATRKGQRSSCMTGQPIGFEMDLKLFEP